MSREKRRFQLDTIDEINMTPLIDLTFLLLIIFMITAPLLEKGINVSPPELNADELPKEDTCLVNLNKLGEIVYEKQVVKGDELVALLKGMYSANPKLTVLFRADGLRKYNEVINVMKIIKKTGIKNISLVTQAESK